MPRVTRDPLRVRAAHEAAVPSSLERRTPSYRGGSEGQISRNLPPQHGRTAGRQDRNRPTRLRTHSRTDQVCRSLRRPSPGALRRMARCADATRTPNLSPLQQGRPPVNAPRDAIRLRRAIALAYGGSKPVDITMPAREGRSLASSALAGSSGLDIPQSLAPIKKTGRR